MYRIYSLLVYALKCYEGNGDELDPLTCNRRSDKMCIKKVFDSGKIQRGCSFTSSLKALKVTSDTCTRFEGGEDCFCSGDLCNSGYLSKPSSIIPSLIFVILFMSIAIDYMNLE